VRNGLGANRGRSIEDAGENFASREDCDSEGRCCGTETGCNGDGAETACQSRKTGCYCDAGEGNRAGDSGQSSGDDGETGDYCP
jgi:hypothetical protein